MLKTCCVDWLLKVCWVRFMREVMRYDILLATMWCGFVIICYEPIDSGSWSLFGKNRWFLLERRGVKWCAGLYGEGCMISVYCSYELEQWRKFHPVGPISRTCVWSAMIRFRSCISSLLGVFAGFPFFILLHPLTERNRSHKSHKSHNR